MAVKDFFAGLGGGNVIPAIKGKSPKDFAPAVPGAAPRFGSLAGGSSPYPQSWGVGTQKIGAPLAQQAVGGNYGTMQVPLTNAPQRDQREAEFLVDIGLGALRNAYEATLRKESAVAGTRPPPTPGRIESFRQGIGAPAAKRQKPHFQQQLQSGNFPLLQGNYQPQMQQVGFRTQPTPPPMYGGFGTAAPQFQQPQFQQPQFQQPQFQPRPQFQQQGQAPQYAQHGRY